MIEAIGNKDIELFLYLNGKHNAFWDMVMVWVTGKYVWIPLYVLLVVFTAIKFRWKSIWIILFAVGLIALADQLSVIAFKEVFERLRPCHNTDIAAQVHLLVGCGGKYGFVSSHAANTFALATFLGTVFRKRSYWLHPLLLLWAVLVSYSRIYVGKHYPLDIVGGMMLGIALAFVFGKLYLYFSKKVI